MIPDTLNEIRSQIMDLSKSMSGGCTRFDVLKQLHSIHARLREVTRMAVVRYGRMDDSDWLEYLLEVFQSVAIQEAMATRSDYDICTGSKTLAIIVEKYLDPCISAAQLAEKQM